MMPTIPVMLPYIVAVTLWLSIIVYAALGGADFGGGVWGLLNFGRRRKDQSRLIIDALGPVWEANNVWLIYLVVGLNTCFPEVAATLSISLFIPFTLALIGIVMRGASFGFRTHFSEAGKLSSTWGNSFSVASLITPFLLGTVAAAVASGDIHVQNGIPPSLFHPWLTPFALVVGFMALGVCATIAAIYLTVEARGQHDEDLANIYRMRAFIAGGVTAVIGLVALFLAPSEASPIWRGVLDHALWAVGVTLLLGLVTVWMLFTRRYQLARIFVIIDVGAFLGTWGLAQLPYIIPPNLTIPQTASPPTTLEEFLFSAIAGLSVLIPSMWFLFHTFKGRPPQQPVHEESVE